MCQRPLCHSTISSWFMCKITGYFYFSSSYEYHHVRCSFYSNRIPLVSIVLNTRAEEQFSAKPKFPLPCIVEWIWALSPSLLPLASNVCRHSIHYHLFLQLKNVTFNSLSPLVSVYCRDILDSPLLINIVYGFGARLCI